MSLSNCTCRCTCTAAAFVVSLILGIIAAFLQITAVITVTPAFLWVAFGIAVVYLAVAAVAAALDRDEENCPCKCSVMNALLLGLLGTILFAVVLLAVGITATSVVSAILVGLLVFFLSLALAETACLIRCITGCGN